MVESTNLVRRRQPGDVDDALTEDLRAKLRHPLMHAVELEAEVFLAKRDHQWLPNGRLHLVRHGHAFCPIAKRQRRRYYVAGGPKLD